MKFSKAIYLVIPLLVSCGTKAPDCADQVSKDLVLELVNADAKSIASSDLYVNTMRGVVQHLSGLSSKNLELSDEFNKVVFSLEKIRETNFDKQSDVHSCAAALISSFKDSKGSIEVRYTSQLSNDKKPNVSLENISMGDYGALFSVLVQEVSSKKISEIKQLRDEIGDANVSNFIEKNCSGFDKNEKLCSLGREAEASIKQEERQYGIERSDYFRKNPQSLREVYNKCGDTYYKAAGLARDSRMLTSSEILKISNVRFELAKADKKFFQECKIAEAAALDLNVEDAIYFKPEGKVEGVSQNNSSNGLEEHEEVDNSQESLAH